MFQGNSGGEILGQIFCHACRDKELGTRSRGETSACRLGLGEGGFRVLGEEAMMTKAG